MKKILIVGAGWIGDMVMAQALFRLLKSQDASISIDVLAAKPVLFILDRMPEVRRAISLPIGHGKLQLIERYQLAKSLRAEAYDQAIVLPNSFKSALIPFWAKIPVRTGWRGEMRYGVLNDLRKLTKQHYPLMVQRYLALGLKPGEHFDTEDYWPRLALHEDALAKALKKYDLSVDKPIVALCPGAAFGPAKMWPESYFSEVAEYFLHKNWSVWFVGGPSEKVLVSEIKAKLPAAIDLTATSLTEAADLMSLAKVVVSNDSGLLHVGCAVGCHVIAIYGSTSPGFTPPLSKKAKILTRLLPCKPCHKPECPLGHFNCLRDIRPAEVIKLIERIESDESTTD